MRYDNDTQSGLFIYLPPKISSLFIALKKNTSGIYIGKALASLSAHESSYSIRASRYAARSEEATKRPRGLRRSVRSKPRGQGRNFSLSARPREKNITRVQRCTMQRKRKRERKRQRARASHPSTIDVCTQVVNETRRAEMRERFEGRITQECRSRVHRPRAARSHARLSSARGAIPLLTMHARTRVNDTRRERRFLMTLLAHFITRRASALSLSFFLSIFFSPPLRVPDRCRAAPRRVSRAHRRSRESGRPSARTRTRAYPRDEFHWFLCRKRKRGVFETPRGDADDGISLSVYVKLHIL